MNKTFLVIMVLAFSIGIGGKFAYDRYSTTEQQSEWNEPLKVESCSSCSAIKQELKSMLELKAKEKQE